ncbi:MAG: sigma-70 family RNA polymerase sigma factor [Planctomycetaceae bacterium]|nr:sigma-70 family RNA polymerase sigma factor [Planctomycetaceae bacterium]
MYSTRSSLLFRVRNLEDGPSWDEFAEVYYPFLEGITRRAGIPVPDAQDIVQDLFVSLLHALPEFEYASTRGRFRGWLRQVVRNRIVDWYRNRSRREQSLAELNWLAEDTPDFEQEHRHHVVRHVLGKVREESQPLTWNCFERHVLEMSPAQDVAEELGVSVNAVYVNSSRTLARVRTRCAEYGGDL